MEACTAGAPPTSALPVPVRPAIDPYRISPLALIGFRDREGFHPATFLCDLPTRVIVLAAEQTVSGGKRVVGGTAWSLARPGDASRAAVPVPILASSKGCLEGEVTCTWDTGSVDEPSIDQLKGPQWVATSGWVHGVEDMCRALPDDTIAVCSTAKRMAYVEVGCQDKPSNAIALQLGLHDESLPRNYDLDVENPVARLYGEAVPGGGDRYTYRFRGAKQTASLVIDTAAKTGWLELDGVREDCMAFGLYRR
ncbi:MAG: hypothetical protein IPQ07_04300 [Myxococcales bacterium]|nr:hypothetical protein [Myxococcales bacterium]